MMRLTIGLLTLLCLAACEVAPPRKHYDLIAAPVTLSASPMELTAAEPMRADNDVVGVCISPGDGFRVSAENWAIERVADRANARLSASAELTDGRIVKLTELSSFGYALCLHPSTRLPLDVGVKSVQVASTAPIPAKSIVWISTAK